MVSCDEQHIRNAQQIQANYYCGSSVRAGSADGWRKLAPFRVGSDAMDVQFCARRRTEALSTITCSTLCTEPSCIIVLSPLSTRTFRTKRVCFHNAHASSDNCLSERCLKIVANSIHRPPTYATKPNKRRHLLPYS